MRLPFLDLLLISKDKVMLKKPESFPVLPVDFSSNGPSLVHFSHF